jgi:hypothetical protein
MNTILQKYCDYSEDLSLNRITQKQFNEKVTEWQQMIRSKMPKFYKMEAHLIFFNFYEPEIIRRSIKEDMEYFYCSKIKNLMFATSAKVYPYQNQIVSVRIILAKFYKMPEEDIMDKEEAKIYKEELTIDPTAPIEEEKDSDDEEMEAIKNGVGKEEQIEIGKEERDAKDSKDTKDTKNNKDNKNTKNPGNANTDNIKPTKQISKIVVENK